MVFIKMKRSGGALCLRSQLLLILQREGVANDAKNPGLHGQEAGTLCLSNNTHICMYMYIRIHMHVCKQHITCYKRRQLEPSSYIPHQYVDAWVSSGGECLELVSYLSLLSPSVGPSITKRFATLWLLAGPPGLGWDVACLAQSSNSEDHPSLTGHEGDKGTLFQISHF